MSVNACSDHDALRSTGINSAVSFKSSPFQGSVLRSLFRLSRRSLFNRHQLSMVDQVLTPPPAPAPVPAALPPAPENAELPPNPPEANVEPEQAPSPDALGEVILYLSSLCRFLLWRFLDHFLDQLFGFALFLLCWG